MLAPAIAFFACADPLSVEGLRCPCAPGYSCRVEDETCVEEPRDGRRAPGPAGGLDLELLSARARERVELGPPGVLALAPLGVEPPGPLQPLQRGEERARVHLEHAARDARNAPGDAEAVHRLEAQRLADEHVQRALDDVGAGFVHDATRVLPVPLDPKSCDLQGRKPAT
jgi:hypothetical protein